MSSPPRPSKFIEGSASTRPDLLARTSTSNELFYNILNEMDEFESRRKHRGSHSSVESLPSSNPSPTNTSNPQYPTTSTVSRSFTVKEGRRSINFTRSSMEKELEVKRRDPDEEHAGDKLARKIAGRLRALTGERRKDKDGDVKTYSGT